MSKEPSHDFEVHILLKPTEVLGPDNKLKDVVLSEFSISSTVMEMNIQYVDTKDLKLYNNGWDLRIRKKNDEKKFELTYKKRYPIINANSGNGQDNINAALETAVKDGFDISSSKYLAQVELGYSKQTLSLSYDEKVDAKHSKGLDLPAAADSHKLLLKDAPENLKRTNQDLLANSIIYGPILAKRYKGTWNDIELDIEVWPIRTSKTDPTLEPVVEASFKTSTLKKAIEGQDNLTKLLTERGWFLAKDSLKTGLIMEAYGEVNSET